VTVDAWRAPGRLACDRARDQIGGRLGAHELMITVQYTWIRLAPSMF